MAESIFNRFSRILSAKVEDSIDWLEQADGEAVMREAIREADRAVNRAKAERDAVTGSRLQAARHHGMLAKRIEALTGKARFAIEGSRDDLAEAALAQQIDFEAQAAKLEEVQAQARDEEARLGEGLAALDARRAQMADALEAYELARRETSAGEGLPRGEASAERKVAAAEQAFARAMGGVNGYSPSRTDAATVGRVAEIDMLQRSAVIAERLAALKAQQVAQ